MSALPALEPPQPIPFWAQNNADIRRQMRAWWTAELTGKTQLNLPDAAERGAVALRADPEFCRDFLNGYLHQAMYDYGLAMLSERRGALAAEDDDIDWSAWMEYDPTGQAHVSLLAMTSEQLLAAAAYRETRMQTEQERIAMLRDFAAQPDTARRDTTRLRDRVRATANVESPPLSAEEDVPAAFDKAADNEIPDTYGQVRTCVRCGCEYDFITGPDVAWDHQFNAGAAGICDHCAWRYPASLLKAAADPFDYALRLRTGELIRFQSCSFHGEWVAIEFGQWRGDPSPPGFLRLPYSMERGVDVRLSDIVWCADAPEGS